MPKATHSPTTAGSSSSFPMLPRITAVLRRNSTRFVAVSTLHSNSAHGTDSPVCRKVVLNGYCGGVLRFLPLSWCFLPLIGNPWCRDILHSKSAAPINTASKNCCFNRLIDMVVNCYLINRSSIFYILVKTTCWRNVKWYPFRLY